MHRWLGMWAPLETSSAEEGVLAGRISGLLYLMGGLTFALARVLPGVSHSRTGWMLAIAGVGAGWGVLALAFVDWRRRRLWLVHGQIAAACVLVAIATAVTGGTRSLAWIYLFFVVVYVAYFHAARMAAGYVVAVVLIQALPLAYDHHAFNGPYLAQMIVATSAYVTLAVAIVSGRTLNSRLRSRAEELAAEQGLLRRVATAVVDGKSASEIYELVSAQTGALLGATGAGVLRLDDPQTLVVVGSWSTLSNGRYEPGRVIPIVAGSNVEQAIVTGSPVLVAQHPAGNPTRQLGYASSIVVPIKVGGRVWGLLTVASDRAHGLAGEDESHLVEVVELLGASIASIEDRATLAAQASSDPLTGLANHRELHERLDREVSRTRRRGEPLSVAVLDIDNFKQLNDFAGHATGDRLLRTVAGCLREQVRAEDTLGRVGGDEFAWILPGVDREHALAAVERARRRITAAAPKPFRITVSAGICDTRFAADASQLIRLADGALYWSKAHGRDQARVYDPEVVEELSAQERADRLARSQALSGLRSLARAIDAKDPATREHSERVSGLVSKLALASGWDAEAAVRLSEAALVHDVGKIGVPDQILRKHEPLTDEEREQIRAHAELSARIVEGVLSDEQVEWVRTHHERPDGRGYPRGLQGDQISEGALLMALADAFDVMTVSRPYSVPKSVDAALAECQELIGRHFSAGAVAALIDLHRQGQLDPPARHDVALTRA